MNNELYYVGVYLDNNREYKKYTKIPYDVIDYQHYLYLQSVIDVEDSTIRYAMASIDGYSWVYVWKSDMLIGIYESANIGDDIKIVPSDELVKVLRNDEKFTNVRNGNYGGTTTYQGHIYGVVFGVNTESLIHGELTMEVYEIDDVWIKYILHDSIIPSKAIALNIIGNDGSVCVRDSSIIIKGDEDAID